ncbi:zinc-dependent alcohol dehydrogenase family protein, partial [Streptomyces sp900116325]|uniref:zinc-dependent alcohol dehydrogenase family protein n=1 Tax=Streptomyces sp. 900116325 TaxID=3154295 RepID=UPI003408A190
MFRELGGPDVLTLEDVTIGEPGPGELRVRVDAIGLNRAEVLFREGNYLDQPTFPSRLGYEAAGIVDAVGPEVAGFAPGDAISVVPGFSQNDYGVYGTYAIVPAASVVHRPESIDAVTGAAVWMPYITAYGALVEIAGVRPGDSALITAASSSVGLAAIQIANHLGVVPIAATRTSAKKQQLLDAGAAHVIVTDDEDVTERARTLSGGEGVQIVFDAVAGPGVEALNQAVAPGGIQFLYGYLDPRPTPLPSGMRPVSIRPYTLFELTYDSERLRRAEHFVNAGLRSGAFVPIVDRVFDGLESIVEAHRYMESVTYTTMDGTPYTPTGQIGQC